MKYHPVVQKIKNLLEKEKVWFETFEHEPVRTSEEAAKIRPGYSLKQGAKAVILRIKVKGGNKFFAMLVLPGDQRFSSDKIEDIFAAKDIRFATEEEVVQLTGGVQPGGVPPFGNLFGLKLIADQTLFKNEKIVFNAGDRRFSIAMKSDDYKKIAEPELKNIV